MTYLTSHLTLTLKSFTSSYTCNDFSLPFSTTTCTIHLSLQLLYLSLQLLCTATYLSHILHCIQLKLHGSSPSQTNCFNTFMSILLPSSWFLSYLSNISNKTQDATFAIQSSFSALLFNSVRPPYWCSSIHCCTPILLLYIVHRVLHFQSFNMSNLSH